MDRPAENIFLTGFMGSGKSTLGKKLAALLHLNFVDLDHYLEQKEKKTISFIFDYEGEEAFRGMETISLLEIVNNKYSTVISLGGGTICFNNNLELVKQKGLLVYIDLPVNDLAGRLKNSQQRRPLLKDLSDAALTDFVAKKLKQREHFYKQSHLIVSGLDLTPNLLAQKISAYKTAHEKS